MRHDTEDTCHCGAAYRGSDHCPECGCEQYESGDCGHTSDDSEGAIPMNTTEPKTINLEPNWEGVRRFVLSIYQIDPQRARDIAAEMGCEAPTFPDEA